MSNLLLKSAYVEITSKCNLFCEHCYNNSNINNTAQLSLEILEKIYQDFSTNQIPSIALSGGEPFMHTNIKDVLFLSERYSLDTQIVTNGVIIDKYVEVIQTNPYLNFQVSIDGVGEVHNTIRGARIFNVLDRNIDVLNECGKYIVAKATINKLNINEYKKIIEYCISKRIPKLSFSILNIQGRAVGNEKISLTNEELRNAIEEIVRFSAEYRNSIEVTPPRITNSLCPFISNDEADVSPRVDTVGNVYLCSMFVNPLFSIGNVKNENITDIVKSDRASAVMEFLNSFNKLIQCKSCYINAICNRGCPAQYLNGMPYYETDTCALKKDIMLQSVIKEYGL